MPTPVDIPVVAIGTNHDPAACGTISGYVSWSVDVPTVPAVVYESPAAKWPIPNPHALAIQTATNRLGECVVFLRGIDPSRAKAMGQNCVVLAARDTVLTFRDTGRIGFVRHGDPICLEHDGTVPHVVRGRGAMTFAVPLPGRDVSTKRTATRPGIVHLTNGSNVAPASAYLFVCEHPYFGITKSDGTFAFDAVPAGDYELVVWHPNWHIVGHDRNPETGLICRYSFGEPLEHATKITVKAGTLTTQNLTLP